MRLEIEEIISDLKQRISQNKEGLRNKVLLKNALESLEEYKKIQDRKLD